MDPRPTWNHPDVKTAAIAEVIDDVRDWAVSSGHVPEDVNMDELRAIVTLAAIETGDAYMAARYLETHVGWPVDGELARIIDARRSAEDRPLP